MPPITSEEEYSKNPKLKREDVQYLREWMSKEPHLPTGVTDQQLILFLHCCHYSLEECKQLIDTYYTMRTHSPQIFSNRDPMGDDVQESLSILQYATMPKRDQNGNVIFVARVVDFDANKFNHTAGTKTWFMMQDVNFLENGTAPGYVILLDTKVCGIGHLARLNISSAKTYALYTQDALPGNVVATHFVNPNAVTEGLLALFKPFMKSEMFSKMYTHSTMDTLYEHVTKDALPEEFGGNLGSLATYSKETVKNLERYRDWFKMEETLRVDESKRPGKAKRAGEVFGVEGSFKKLDID